MKDLKTLASSIAREANRCCVRRDGYEEHMQGYALHHLMQVAAPQPTADDLVKLIGDTLFDAIEENAACVYGARITGHESMLGPKDVIGVDDGDLEMEPLARAVLSKLRAAGLIEISGEEPAPIVPKAAAEPVERQPLADLIPSIEPMRTPLYEAAGRKLGR